MRLAFYTSFGVPLKSEIQNKNDYYEFIFCIRDLMKKYLENSKRAKSLTSGKKWTTFYPQLLSV